MFGRFDRRTESFYCKNLCKHSKVDLQTCIRRRKEILEYRLLWNQEREICYFLIPMSNKSNLNYVFVAQTSDREIKIQFLK